MSHPTQKLTILFNRAPERLLYIFFNKSKKQQQQEKPTCVQQQEYPLSVAGEDVGRRLLFIRIPGARPPT